jgi:hypothetical protein
MSATCSATRRNGCDAGQYNRNPATGYCELNHISLAGVPPSAIRNVDEKVLTGSRLAGYTPGSMDCGFKALNERTRDLHLG